MLVLPRECTILMMNYKTSLNQYTVYSFRGLFSKSTQKEPVPGWKLFGKVPAKDARDNNKDSHIQSSSFDRG